ncbi:MAG TPA: TolC family protein [Novosphingobium sp.]|nr:TolC family protein [Novosphingobium sp.]
MKHLNRQRAGARHPVVEASLAALAAALLVPGAPAKAQIHDGTTPAASDSLSAGDVVPPEGAGRKPEGRSASEAPAAPAPAPGSIGATLAAPPSVSGASARDVPASGSVTDPGLRPPEATAGANMDALPAASAGYARESGGTTFYGPPSPKARKGVVPAMGWTEPTFEVPPALEEAVQTVTKNYPSVQAARAALRAAASDVKAAKWLRFPSIGANMSYLDNQGSPQPQLVVEAPIWSGGRIGASIQRAKAEEDVTSAAYVETVQDLALTTVQTYFEIARLTEREKMFAESLREHLRLVETMERRVDQEVSPQADLELARSRAAQIEQEYTETRSQRRTQLRVLAELIADPDFQLGPIPFYDPDSKMTDLTSLEDQAVAFDPTLHRLYGQTDVARAELAAKKASILPQVNAQYSYDDIFGSRVGVVVRSQTTGGLSQFAEVSSARTRIQAELERARVAEQTLRRDIASTIITYEAARERASISRSAAITASRVSASYTRQFIAGRRSWLDVMNALREAVSAQIGQSDAEFTAMAAGTVLLLRSGRWRPVFADGTSENMNGANYRGE